MTKRERLLRERKRLVLAESDMKQAAAAAAHFVEYGADMNGDAERALITGIIVTYARPFTASRGSSLGAIQGRLAEPESPALRHLHAELLQRRNDLFAHNDETEFRDELDIVAHLGDGEGRFVEAWTPVDYAVFASIERMASAQRDRFRSRIEEIAEALRASDE
ncbi:MAG TPA: hypothetical protein VFU51_04000 [Gaiellaceae bacterium]|nr:hypothetical protein [Gaiellaceae bacterium]